MFSRKRKFILLLTIGLGLLAVAIPVFAATPDLNLGLEYARASGLVDTDVRIIIARIINAALGLLGVVALALVLYGGYEYMTAAGDEEKITKAKKILINAAIGLAIILSAFAITRFVISKLTDAIVGTYCAEHPADCQPAPPPSGCINPADCPGLFSFFAGITPQGQLPLYNVVVRVNFYGGFGDKAVKQSTITSDNFKVQKALAGGGLDNNYSGTFTFSSPSSVAFHPSGSCGEGNPNSDCFEKDTTYKVTLSSLILSDGDEKNLDCSGANCVATFTTGNLYDAAAPLVSIVLPGEGSVVGAGRNTLISAMYSDDSGVNALTFKRKNSSGSVSNILTFTISPFEKAGEKEYGAWQPVLANPDKAEFQELMALAFDLDNHQTTSSLQKVKVVPAYCFNGAVDEDKKEEKLGDYSQGIPDCGSGSECGACPKGACVTSFDCAGTYCDPATKTCVARPKITNVDPKDGAYGNYITLFGQNFGQLRGQVAFLGNEQTSVDDKVVSPVDCYGQSSWQNNIAIVEVPEGAVSGPLEIRPPLNNNPANYQNLERDGLIGYWTFDRADASADFKQIFDKSGKGKNGTAENLSLADGQIGQAGVFGGPKSPSSVVTPNVGLEKAKAMTASVWFKVEDIQGGNTQVLFSKGSGGEYSFGMLLWQGSIEAHISKSLDDNSTYCAWRIDYQVNQWHQAAMVYNGSGASDTDKLKIYLDGAQLPLQPGNCSVVGLPSHLTDSGAGLFIGQGFSGLEDDLRIYNRALSAAEVKRLYTGYTDATNDDWGPNFPVSSVFLVNEVKRPGLCYVAPSAASPATILDLYGGQLGETQGDSGIYFGETAARIRVSGWESWAVRPEVPPTMLPQDLRIRAKVGGEWSNGLPFTVLPAAVSAGPRIDYIEPASGPVGTYLTIFGQNFGASGAVRFKRTAEDASPITADLPPPYCSDSWSPTQIIVKVPEAIADEMSELTTKNYLVEVGTAAGVSNLEPFEVNKNALKPGLCLIEPNNGPAGTAVTLKGERFGEQGQVEYWENEVGINVSWGDAEIKDKVPAGAKTGQVKVWSETNQVRSNSLNFTVQDCQTDKSVVCAAGTTCCASGSCAATCPEAVGPKSSVYAWSFSTGKIPLVPRVLEICGAGKVPSPSPYFKSSNLDRPAEDVCVNAQIQVRFSTLIKPSTVAPGSSFMVEICGADSNCASGPIALSPGSLNFSLTDGRLAEGSGGGVDTVSFQPLGGQLVANNWYRVRLTTAVKGLEDIPMAGEYSFKFKTRNNTNPCQLDQAVVSPDSFTAMEFGHTYPALYHVTATALDHICWALDAYGYDWQWNAGASAGADVTSDYATVTNNTAEGTSMDYSSPTLAGTYDTNGNAGEVYVSGNYAYVADGDSGLQIIDISNPAFPTFAGAYDTIGNARGVYVLGKYAYVADNNSGLQIIDISNPASPDLIGTYDTRGYAIGVYVSDKYAYVANYYGLQIIDISNPASPTFAGAYDTSGEAFGVYVSGQYAYVADGDSGLQIIDISNPASPALAGAYNTPGVAVGVYVSGQYAYVADGTSGLQIINISNPASPALAGAYNTSGNARGVYVSDKYAYVADGFSGLQIIDISNSAFPTFISNYNTNGEAYRVNVSGKYAYVADDTSGLQIVEVIKFEQWGLPQQDLTTKNKETTPLPEGREKVWAQTVSGGQTVNDWAALYISPSKPRVLEHWPVCSTACINTGIGALFSQDIDENSINATNITFCKNSGSEGNCDGSNLPITPSLVTSSTLNIAYTGNLLPYQYYRVIIKGGESGVKSEGGAILDPESLKYQCDGAGKNCQSFSWTFRTKNDSDACEIKTVEMLPASATVYWIGAQASYFSQAKGSPSECGAGGEKLNSWAYDWSWASGDDNVATVTDFDRTVGLALGCAVCAHTGSLPAPAGGYCGNRNTPLDKGEECEPPGSGNNCSLNCLSTNKTNQGTLPCAKSGDKDCCGNGGTYAGIEAGEDCDLGRQNGQAGSGCTASCLFSGTPISFAVCRGTLGKTEAECATAGAIAVCGNEVIEPGEDCDGGDNCTRQCLWKNKQQTADPLYCGNGRLDAGEDCDFVGTGDNKVDPRQFARAEGNGTVVNEQQTTTITASTSTKSDAAEFILQCGFSPVDANCPVGGAGFGIGKDSCCYPRPTVTKLQPAVPTNVCPNTALIIHFDKKMDISTLTPENIILSSASSTGGNPGDNCVKVGPEIAGNPVGFWQKILAFFKKLLGRSASAAGYFCSNGIDYTVSASSTFAGGVEGVDVELKLKNMLRADTTDNAVNDYRIFIVKDQVRTIEGVTMAAGAPNYFDFDVGKDICKIDHLTVKPTAYLFRTIFDDPSDNTASAGADSDENINDKDKIFSVTAYYKNKAAPGSPNQEIVSYPDVYDWTYAWTNNNSEAVNITPTDSADTLAAAIKNGLAALTAEVTIGHDVSSPSEAGKKYSARGLAQVFICENPWPAIPAAGINPTFGLGYVDALGNTNGVAEGKGWTNFKLLYCRDAGKSNDTSDDLPELKLPAVLYH